MSSVEPPSPEAKSSARRAEKRRPTAEPASPPAQAQALEDVVEDFGSTLAPQAVQFADYASAVQEGRHGRNATDRQAITRSTAIWAAASFDPRIAEVMSAARFDMESFGTKIGAAAPPTAAVASRRPHLIEPEFAASLRAALASRAPVTTPVSVADLASAILNEPSGRVLTRLRDAGGDLRAAVAALSALGFEAGVLVDPRSFSGSVRAARERLGQDSVVTASALAGELATRHGELADGRLGRVSLQRSEGSHATTDSWLAQVAGCYDRAAVAASRHQVIDTRLTLLALSALDTRVAQALARDGVVSWLRENVEVQPERLRADPTEWSADSPARIDELGRAAIAKDLAKRIDRLAREERPDEASFMVHIDGPWGAGKSSMFRFLRTELEGEFIVVDVNAWREQRVGVQWWTLFSALQGELARRAETSTAKVRLWSVGTMDRIRANWVPFTIAMAVIVAAVIGVLIGPDLTGTSAAADSIVKVVSLATLIFGGLAAVSRYVIPSSRRSAQGIWENSANPTREVARYFLRALSRAPKPVVFLIDDLDRCDGQYVVEFLEVVQTLVRDGPRMLDAARRSAGDGSGEPSDGGATKGRNRGRRRRRPIVGPFVFVAADGAWIRSSFEEHFKTFERTFERGRPLGYLFLEKLFQLHVRLPDVTPAAQQAYLSRLLGVPVRHGEETPEQRTLIEEADRAVAHATSESAVLAAAEKATNISDPVTRLRVLGHAAGKFSDRAIEESPDHPLADFHPLLEPKPRSMKLFVNAYGIARSMLTVQERFVPIEQLALWTVLEVRWPRLADYLREDPDRAATLADGPQRPDDIQLMLADPQVVRVLGDPRWKGFDPDRVRQCAGVS